jgi:hypothetical protein
MRGGRGLALLGVAVVACAGADNASTRAPGRLTVAPTSLDLDVTETLPLAAIARDSLGRPVRGASVRFKTNRASVASVTADGLVTGVSPGSATITASSAQGATSVPVVVALRTGPVARVEVVPDAMRVAVGATMTVAPTAFDSLGRPIASAGPATFTTSDPTVASVDARGRVRGVRAGSAVIEVAIGERRGTAHLVVARPAAGVVVDVIPTATYQTILGWQGAAQLGQDECNRQAFPLYRDTLVGRIATELGINRVTVALRSGSETRVDSYRRWIDGQLPMADYRKTWFRPTNDNDDPFVADSAGFQWSEMDSAIEKVIVPLRARLVGRGESLYVTLAYVDFLQGLPTKPFAQMKEPNEFAELVVEAFRHFKAKYGWTPDAFEMNIEPEHTLYDATDMGRAIVATGTRLRAAGFTPHIIAPSTTSMASAATFYDAIVRVPGAREFLTDIAYHRYAQVSRPALAQIAARARTHGIRAAMLEHIGSGYEDLHEDLAVGGVSSWMQFGLAYCSKIDDFNTGAVYYSVNQSDPARPRINLTSLAKFLRQYFLFVRAGAIRVGAVSTDEPSVSPVAFRNRDGKFAVVVKAAGGASFTVRGLPAGTYGLKFTTDARHDVDLPDVRVEAGGSVPAAIPAKGVITIYAR